MAVLHSAPKFIALEGAAETLREALGDMATGAREAYGEVLLTVRRETIAEALTCLRDQHGYQQLMEIAGVDYPEREERFEVVYMLLSLTKNHRVMVKCTASETTPVPTVTHLWPVAGWLEREVFDLYGVVFDGNTDLRRILTDYGFEGHPFRKDFPLTGYVELRYSEEDKRVVYEPVKLAQDLRQFDFLSPWEGADYILPGDEKSATPTPAPVPSGTAPEVRGTPQADVPKTTENPEDTGAGKAADDQAAEKVSKSKIEGEPVPKVTDIPAPGAPDPTEDRPDRKPRKRRNDNEGGAGPASEGSLK